MILERSWNSHSPSSWNGDNWVSQHHLIYLDIPLNKKIKIRGNKAALLIISKHLLRETTQGQNILSSQGFCLSGSLCCPSPPDTAASTKLFFFVSNKIIIPGCWTPGAGTQRLSFLQGIYDYMDCLNVNFLLFILKLKVFPLPSLPVQQDLSLLIMLLVINFNNSSFFFFPLLNMVWYGI